MFADSSRGHGDTATDNADCVSVSVSVSNIFKYFMIQQDVVPASALHGYIHVYLAHGVLLLKCCINMNYEDTSDIKQGI